MQRRPKRSRCLIFSRYRGFARDGGEGVEDNALKARCVQAMCSPHSTGFSALQRLLTKELSNSERRNLRKMRSKKELEHYCSHLNTPSTSKMTWGESASTIFDWSQRELGPFGWGHCTARILLRRSRKILTAGKRKSRRQQSRNTPMIMHIFVRQDPSNVGSADETNWCFWFRRVE